MRNLLLLALAMLLPAEAPAAVKLPAGFSASQVAAGITGATAMEVAADGRVFVCEQTGALRVVKNDTLLPEPFVRLKVDSFWERGLIGVALDPHFPKDPYVYLCYVTPDPYPHHRISRFTAEGDVAKAGSEVILFEGDNQNMIGGDVPAGHQGGAIHFGRDGKLYVALGEQTAGTPAQRMDSLLGKMLRLNPDGTIPNDNPFLKTTRGKYQAIWALGLRNPFTFAVQPGTGRIFINDVGGVKEEINEGVPGANYGWPTVEHGPTNDPRFRGPVHCYPTNSITGGAFLGPPASSLEWKTGALPTQFPPEYRGQYFFPDFTLGWIKVLDPEDPRNVRDFASGLARPVDLKFAPDGSLYALLRGAWVIDKDFQPNTGSLLRIRYIGETRSDPPPALAARAVKPPEPPPPIMPASGDYTGPITVRLNLGMPGDTVRYALDGNEPSASSPVYQGPFPVANSTIVAARAFNAQGAPVGIVFRAVYTIRGQTPYGLPDRPPVEGLNVPLDPSTLPKRLSETGVFTALAELSPRPGLVPYDVISPLWSDGAAKRRWIALPGGETITFRPRGEWSFPRGTVFVKHFELPIDSTNPNARRRLETRLLVVDGTSGGYGVTYKWRPDQSDADLLTEGTTEEITVKTPDGTRTQTWAYPSRDDCLKCHTTNAGFVLGPKTRQLNTAFHYPSTGRTDNQLRTWNYLGMFEPKVRESQIPKLDRLVALDDPKAPLEARVRSYLDANCNHCHRPGANIPATFDARYDTPLADQKLIDNPTVSDRLGLDRPRVVAPGDLGRSMLYQRLLMTDRFKMPPLARNEVDRQAVAAVAEWIRGLPAHP